MREPGATGSWEENLPKLLSLNPYWSYSWGHEMIPQQPPQVEFLPMFWGKWNIPTKVDQVKQLVATGRSNYLLGFNEPDMAHQANMKVREALDLWPALESLNVPLVSPSCAHPDGPWMTEFMGNATKECRRVDLIGVHWYGGANFEAFRATLVRFYELHGKRPILITEFAPADWVAKDVGQNRHSEAAVLAFMKQALPWLEAQNWIHGYAWFSFSITAPQGTSSALLDSNGNLTACGRFYASVRSDNPNGDQSVTV